MNTMPGGDSRVNGAGGSPLNALSVDVEEYFQVSAFAPVIERSEWEQWPSRVDGEMNVLLDLLGEHQARATFFTLGYIAERHSRLVRRIHDEGHEVACHGYDHTRVSSQTAAEFRSDIRKSKALLEDIIGSRVTGFRAASFSLDARSPWAYDELADAGFCYSSSIYPIKHDHYGAPQAPRTPFRLADAPAITEIPISTVRACGRNLPAGGGGYFRLLPYRLSRALLAHLNKSEGVAANMYFHPWEFDPGQPRPAGVSVKTRFRHYVCQGRALERLKWLLEDFVWSTFNVVYSQEIEGKCPMVPRSLVFANA